MATASTRALWKGAISFGLVHIPVNLHSATEDSRPKMKMIDRETMSAVGHKNISKATGEEVDQADIVKGMETTEKGQFVTLTKEEIREALPKTTQTIEIEGFVRQADVPMAFYNKPYYVSPAAKGGKPYALLRDVLKRTGRIGLGRVVISSRQHLAVVAPYGDVLVVNLLRWAEEVRDTAGLPIPGDAKELGVTDREMKMGEQLVMDLAEEWSPERFKDEFKAKVEALVEQKRKAGAVSEVATLVASEIMPATADVLDLTELLRRSLRNKAAGTETTKERSAAAANDEPVPLKRAAAKKSGDKARASVKTTRRKSG